MNKRNTAGRLGFIKDSEGIYRKGNFIYKNGRVIRESQIVPEGTIKDLKDDDFITLDECIRSILAYSTTIGDTNPRATNVYIDKIGNSYKPAKALSKNTVAVVMSNRQVMELKPRNVLDQDDNSKLKNKDKENKPAKAKVIKDFSKPVEFDKLKKESATKKVNKLKLKEADEDSVTYTNEEGHCPKCGEANLDYGSLELEGNMCYYPYKCDSCGQEGEEWYSMSFAGHNVYDENGELIEL